MCTLRRIVCVCNLWHSAKALAWTRNYRVCSRLEEKNKASEYRAQPRVIQIPWSRQVEQVCCWLIYWSRSKLNVECQHWNWIWRFLGKPVEKKKNPSPLGSWNLTKFQNGNEGWEATVLLLIASLAQGCPTGRPRAACSPQGVMLWPLGSCSVIVPLIALGATAASLLAPPASFSYLFLPPPLPLP